MAFEFRKMRFVYNEAANVFERLKFPVHEPFEYYLKATGMGHIMLFGGQGCCAVLCWDACCCAAFPVLYSCVGVPMHTMHVYASGGLSTTW